MFVGLLYCLYGVVGATLLGGLWRLNLMIKRFSANDLPELKPLTNQDEMASVSVCIPARNESHAMTECLQGVLLSKYPKLEILVLDDQSADKTPSLIKAFAHDGVRFIEGTPSPAGWLGKNHALNQLLGEASGRLVLFMDVDTRIKPDTIGRLVSYMNARQANMISVIPRRDDGPRASVVFAPLRYLWEILFDRHQAPAVSSAVWMLDRHQFEQDFSDFSKLRHVIQPEAHIAATYRDNHTYRLLMSSEKLGVSQQKKWRSQIDTSIRLLYPLIGSRLNRSLVVVSDLLVLSLPPLVTIIAGLVGISYRPIFVGVAVYLLGVVLYGYFLKHIWSRGWLIAALLWPVIVLQEAVLVVVSTIQYRRGRVMWKGRPVELPAAAVEAN